MTSVAAWYPILPLNLCEYKVFRLGTASIIFGFYFLHWTLCRGMPQTMVSPGPHLWEVSWYSKIHKITIGPHFPWSVTLVFSLMLQYFQQSLITSLWVQSIQTWHYCTQSFLDLISWVNTMQRNATNMVSPGPHLWVVSQVQNSKDYTSYFKLWYLA